MHRAADRPAVETLFPVAVVLGVSFVVGGAAGAGAAHRRLRVMSPTSENTSMLLIALIAGGARRWPRTSAARRRWRRCSAACCSSSCNPRPWAWPRQLGTAASLLTMLMFVLVSVVAAKADWNPAVAGLVAALVLARARSPRSPAWSLANWGSGTSWRQAFWTGCAMSPMSSVALLLVSQFVSCLADARAARSPASRCRRSC